MAASTTVTSPPAARVGDPAGNPGSDSAGDSGNDPGGDSGDDPGGNPIGDPIRDPAVVFAKSSGFLSAVLPKGMRAVALEVSAENAAGGGGVATLLRVAGEGERQGGRPDVAELGVDQERLLEIERNTVEF